jgi:uncharacterized membrane protein YbhN (UPF0104 family)
VSALTLAAAGFAAYSGGFVVVLRCSTDASVLGAMSAFSLAWLVGFAAVPVPAGLGVREATLVALLAGTTGTSTVVAVSVIYRVICILVEVLLAAVTSLGVRRAKRPAELEVASPPRSAMASIDAARPVQTRE